MINVENISVSFKNNQVPFKIIENLSLKIKPKEIYSLVGESGCGKTILALSIMNLVQFRGGEITAGSINIDGLNITTLPEFEMRKLRGNKVSMIFQEPLASLNPVMPLYKQLAEPLIIHRNCSFSEAMDILLPLFESMGIEKPANKVKDFPFQFSGGQLQRLCIASAISTDPAYLIADEPTTALDPTIQKEVLSIIINLAKEKNMGVCFISHDLPLISQLSDRTGVIYSGRIVEENSTRNIIYNSTHPYTKALIDSVSYPNKWEPLKYIKGDPPVIYRKPSGCYFAERCNNKKNNCDISYPAEINLSGGRVSCFYPYE